MLSHKNSVGHHSSWIESRTRQHSDRLLVIHLWTHIILFLLQSLVILKKLCYCLQARQLFWLCEQQDESNHACVTVAVNYSDLFSQMIEHSNLMCLCSFTGKQSLETMKWCLNACREAVMGLLLDCCARWPSLGELMACIYLVFTECVI